MEAIKAFFAKDNVKLIAGILFVALSSSIALIPEGPLKENVKWAWLNVITPAAVFLGIVSGGTSGLRSNASSAQAAVLVEKGVVPPKV